MQFTDEAGWKEGLKNNTDDYGRGVYVFAERWANTMEREIAKGKRLADIAQDTSHEADTDGITGFMYGCAVNILTHCWVHGEELRKWHNNRFNHSGDGVVNPAVITIKT